MLQGESQKENNKKDDSDMGEWMTSRNGVSLPGWMKVKERDTIKIHCW